MDWLIEVGKQVPSLGVLAWIVHSFLKHLADREKGLAVIAEACHSVQRDAIRVMQENAAVMAEIKESLKKD